MKPLNELKHILKIEALQDNALNKILKTWIDNEKDLREVRETIKRESQRNEALVDNYYGRANPEKGKLKLETFADIHKMFKDMPGAIGTYDVWFYNGSETVQDKDRWFQWLEYFQFDLPLEYAKIMVDKDRDLMGKDYRISNVEIFMGVYKLPDNCPHEGYLLERKNRSDVYLFYFRNFVEFEYKIDLIDEREVVLLDIDKLLFLQMLGPFSLSDLLK